MLAGDTGCSPYPCKDSGETTPEKPVYFITGVILLSILRKIFVSSGKLFSFDLATITDKTILTTLEQQCYY
jgi:hypothetical protein